MKLPMQEKHLFEYAIIRVVPCVEREEFLNVGVIFYCPSQNFLKTIFEINKARLDVFSCAVSYTELYDRLEAFNKICAGKANGGAIGQLPLASRFRWLTATRSTVIQTSKVHPGLCDDANETLFHLFEQLVKI